jgi:hypothetical protein
MEASQAYVTGMLIGHLLDQGVTAIPISDEQGFTEFIDIQLPIIVNEEAMVVRITIVPIERET